MPTPVDVNTLFDVVKRNHERYNRENKLSSVELTGGPIQSKLVRKYINNLHDYRISQERYLKNAIKQISFKEKAKHFGLASLLGLGVGTASFFALKSKPSPLNALAPVELPTDIAGGAFSAFIATSITALAYEAWLSSKEHEKKVAGDYESFQKTMKNAGFNAKRFENLSADLVKLFHFRECVLLNLDNGFNTRFRDDYISRYTNDLEPINHTALNSAIETYFLEQLSALFDKVYLEISNFQDEEIKSELNDGLIIGWLKRFFEKSETRFQFTLQLQIRFMETCLEYFEKEMIAKTFKGRHPLMVASLLGLIAATISLLIAQFIFCMPICITEGSLAFLAFSVTTALCYQAFTRIECLKYVKSKADRAAIHNVIGNVTKECLKLNRSVTNTLKTTQKDIKALNDYHNPSSLDHTLARFTNLLTGFNSKALFMGSARAWPRDYAARYRHCKGIEIDLVQAEKLLIETADDQTKKLQKKLFDIMSGKTHTSKNLNTCIENTRAYLKNKNNNQFIQEFELREKIRQQILEIVSATPKHATQEHFPLILVSFYTDPIHLGGLGGAIEDLTRVRELAPDSSQVTNSEAEHSFRGLVDCAQRLNNHLTQHKDYNFIFTGDRDFRELLGLPIENQYKELENNIGSGQIGKYLENSYNFLYSLNELTRPPHLPNGMDMAIENSKEFTLYRMLLLLQLAKLSDPNNLLVEESVRRDIYEFVKERFNIENPVQVFDDMVNQTLFVDRQKTGARIQGPMKTHLISDLEWVADAIRLDIAYASRPKTPRMLVEQIEKEFLSTLDASPKILFGMEQSKTYLVPESTSAYFSKVADSIKDSRSFLNFLRNKRIITNSGTFILYLKSSLDEVDKVIKQIDDYPKLIQSNKDSPFSYDTNFLNSSLAALNQFKKELQRELPQELQEVKAISPTNKLGKGFFGTTAVKEKIQHLFHKQKSKLPPAELKLSPANSS